MKKLSGLLLLFGICIYLPAQKFYFPKKAFSDSLELSKAIPALASKLIVNYRESNYSDSLSNLSRLQVLAGRYSEADVTLDSLRYSSKETDPQFWSLVAVQHKLYVRAKLRQAATSESFNSTFEQVFEELFKRLDDIKALHIYTAFLTRNGTDELQTDLQNSLSNLSWNDSLNMNEALGLCRSYYTLLVYKNMEPIAKVLLKEDGNRRYIIEDSVLIKTTEGATLSAVVVRKRDVNARQPSALFFTIYSDLNRNSYEAMQSAAHGYVGVVADTRGKRLSTDPIEPYEHEAKDVNAVIDWIIKQPWSNGKVAMYGGSYSGFAQWAATKYLRPALKTIVPYVAAIPGYGLPMENNIFLNANYGWAFYVTNNRYLDNKTYNDPKRWETLQNIWYASGAAYNKIDSIDGTPNEWLQRWLAHPSYDKYWQSMVPYKEEFSKINIPVLTITGYYDDGQISALRYLEEHYKYNKKANHYLIIGPYDHFGAQRGGVPVLREYRVDSVALIDTREITYQWFDHILKNGTKPAILKDRINYEVMGRNEWKHAPSLEKMHNKMLTFYLANTTSGNFYQLSLKKPDHSSFISQDVNFADRSTKNNNDYYPYPIIEQQTDTTNGLFFISEPFDQPVSIDGMFEGRLNAIINKKDMDFGVTLFEVMPDGKYFHLSYYLGRASYARDMSKRQLLFPGTVESVTFDRSRMVCRQLSKGSRLLVVLNINKNPDAQINYGTGRNVSEETIQDATTPLQIKWYNDSFIKIPVWSEKHK
jgi:putative CocE/NonD family hydrolase